LKPFTLIATDQWRIQRGGEAVWAASPYWLNFLAKKPPFPRKRPIDHCVNLR